MAKVLLNYDVQTGTLTNESGMTVGTWAGLPTHKELKGNSKVEDMIKLKNSGFTAEEVIEMGKAGLI